MITILPTTPPATAVTFPVSGSIGHYSYNYAAYKYVDIKTQINLHVIEHLNRVGSESQRPELLQVTVASPTSENPGSHWKVMTEPSARLVF